MIQSSNPVLRKLEAVSGTAGEAMTAEGAAGKTGMCLLVLWLCASYTWAQVFSGINPMPLALLGAVGGLIVGIVTVVKIRWAPATALLYAALEGLMVGGVSGLLEVRFPGIAIQAVSLTFAVLVSMIVLYRARVFKVTPKFTMGLLAAGGAVTLVYLTGFAMQLFGARIPFIHESGPAGILFSLAVIVIASLYLVLDFDLIEKGAETRAPKFMEWYAAFGLTVTLVWLYLEILRLLAKLRPNRQ